MTNEKSKNYPSHKLNWKGKVIVGAFGLACAIFFGSKISMEYKNIQEKIKPLEKSVKSNYVLPNKLEILSKDLNKNEKYETPINYDGKTYPLKINEQRQPFVQEYKSK